MFRYVAVFCVLSSFVYNGECFSLRDAPCSTGCPFIYDPVCGRDGTTYNNKCHLDCAGVKIENAGPCGVIDRRDETADCACGRSYKPVCGSDDVTYANKCLLDCVGVTLKHDDKCRSPKNRRRICACPQHYSPVCGGNGVTYGNACGAKCDDVEVASLGVCGSPSQLPAWPVAKRGGEIPAQLPAELPAQLPAETFAKRQVAPAQLPVIEPICFCPAIFDRHCADDGSEFANKCVADCAKVKTKPCDK